MDWSWRDGTFWYFKCFGLMTSWEVIKWFVPKGGWFDNFFIDLKVISEILSYEGETKSIKQQITSKVP